MFLGVRAAEFFGYENQLFAVGKHIGEPGTRRPVSVHVAKGE